MLLRSSFLILSLLGVVLSAHSADSAPAPLVALDHFVRDDEFSIPRLSPDGKHLAITARIQRGERAVPTIMVYALPDMKQISATQLRHNELALSYTWVSNTRIVLEVGKELGSREAPARTGEVIAMDLDGANQRYLYGYDMIKRSGQGDRYGDHWGYGYVTGIPRTRNGHFYMTTYTLDDVSLVYDINAVNGARQVLTTLRNPNVDFVLQRNGTPRFAVGTANVKNESVLYLRDDKTDKWSEVGGDAARLDLRPFAFNADDTEFLATISTGGGPRELVRESVASGTRVSVLKDKVGSIDAFQFGANQDLPFAARTRVGIPVVHYLNDSAEAKLHKMLSSKFPGQYVGFINYTDDGSRLLFSVHSDREPGAYFLFDRGTGKAYPLFASRQQIDPEQMAERRPITFAARDGLQLHGFITLPKRSGGKAPPMVLMPHGGPHGVADDWFFDNDAQFLASRGYAVLQVNYRGSGGRGGNFKAAGFRQWGGKIQEDLIDGVRWSLAQGLADGKRVCAYGTSFGGYSALMVTLRAPEMFKCAVGYAGVYDLNLILDDEDAKKGTLLHNIFADYIGTDRAELNRNSPALQAASITVPVLLVHGKEDKRAPFRHALRMREGLQRAGRPPEWMAVDDEGHGFYATKNVTAFYEKLEAFLGKHLQ